MDLPRKHVRISRVLHEDDELMTVEVVKNEQRELKLEEGDKFLTLVFIHNLEGTKYFETWIPWEASDG